MLKVVISCIKVAQINRKSVERSLKSLINKEKWSFPKKGLRKKARNKKRLGGEIMVSGKDSSSAKCAFCQAGGRLQVSHIIPRFVVNWLKKSSATGFLRGAKNPNLRLQDTMKMPLLCSDCEERFSKFEKYFAEQIFFPYQNRGTQKFSYDESLLKFILSISWRILYYDQQILSENAPDLVPYAKCALKTWKDYLLESRQDEGNYEHHMFFLDFVKESTVEIPAKFQWYTLRAIDGCLALSEEIVFAYTKFPGIILVSAIHPPKLEGWIDTRIKRSGGEIAPPQKIAYPGFYDFLIDRVNRIFDSGMSKIQKNKIAETIRNNPERFLFSKSFEVTMAERMRKRKGKKQALPRSVRELIDIVEKGEIDQSLPRRDKNLQKLQFDLIASRLAELDLIAAQRLERDILNNISAANDSYKEQLTISDQEDIVIFFLTLLGTTKSERFERINKMFNEIEINGRYPKAKVILMITWDPTDPIDRTYDWGCQLR